jgi:simple sugar transport system ATP-binding protein
VLLVSADLDEIMALADRIGVLYRGRLIRESRREDITREQVGFTMMGERRDG